MRMARWAAVVLLFAGSVHADCIGLPARTLNGWKSMSGWTLPGDMFAVSYVCSGEKRKIVVERFMSRMAPEVHYVSDIDVPPLVTGEILLERAQCTREDKLDGYLVPFGNFAKSGVARVRHAWRIEIPSGRILPVDVSTVRCRRR